MTFHEVEGRKNAENQPIRIEETRICPYNKSHKIRAEKWDLHLMKCRENHPDSGLVMCKYVYGHHIPIENIEEHEKECYEEQERQRNKNPLNDPTFVIPNPLRSHPNGSVSSFDPEWEEEVETNDQAADEDRDGKPLLLENAGEKNELGGMPKTDRHNVYNCDFCMVD